MQVDFIVQLSWFTGDIKLSLKLRSNKGISNYWTNHCVPKPIKLQDGSKPISLSGFRSDMQVSNSLCQKCKSLNYQTGTDLCHFALFRFFLGWGVISGQKDYKGTRQRYLATFCFETMKTRQDDKTENRKYDEIYAGR